jgi:1-acyl-sn-glycerol-3-phosphate acyltransferase
VLVLRSAIFQVAFYAVTTAYTLATLPFYLLPPWGMVGVAKAWGRVVIWLLRVICNITLELRGRENIPPGALLVAPKHQSAWETATLLSFFDYPTFVLKRELIHIPIFGWALLKAGMIPVDRDAGKGALAGLIARVRKALAQHRQVIVFPEGTRRPVGAEPDYKLGLVQVYAASGVPCLPVALNSGLFWPRRSFLRHPGTIVVEFLPPIPAGLPRSTFFRRLQNELETATARLVSEAERERAAAQAPQFKRL